MAVVVVVVVVAAVDMVAVAVVLGDNTLFVVLLMALPLDVNGFPSSKTN